jgi:hypothetical protein
MRWCGRLVGLLIFVGCFVALIAAPHAIIVVGLTAGDLATKRLEDQAGLIRQALLGRGISPDNITVLGPRPPVKREALLQTLVAEKENLEETWIVLLGTVAPGRDGAPAFQLSGPRLSAEDFTRTIAALPGNKKVVVATSLGAGFIRPLQSIPAIEAVAATRKAGEVNEPYFAEAWASALQADPQAKFAVLAQAAAGKVAQHYAELNLAQPEHAQLLDTLRGTVVDATSAIAAAPMSETKLVAATKAPATAASIQIPTAPLSSEPSPLAATEETKSILHDASTNAANSPFDAVIIRREIAVVIETAGNSIESQKTRTYVCRSGALDTIATLRFPPATPNQIFRLQAARVIRPDGTQIILPPRMITAGEQRAQPRNQGENEAIQLPDVSAGCVVEINWSVESHPDGQLPGFYQEWILADPYPVLSSHFECSYPANPAWHWFAQNAPTVPQHLIDAEGKGSMLTWDATNLPADEPMPGDPALRSWRPWIAVTSIASWSEFAAWYRRITSDAMQVGPATKTLADELARQAHDRSAQLRLAYERVAALRYVAVELGIGALRPRTPDQVLLRRYGDCKDKANLLVALLRSIGINAEFALVNRSDHTFGELPGWQFNHAIVRVPADSLARQTQDLWLDPTDRLVPFGVMSPGIVGRLAMVYPEKGETVFATVASSIEPPAEWEENWEFEALAGDRQKARVELRAVGAAETELRRIFAGVSPASRVWRFQQLIAGTHPALSVESVQFGDPFNLTTEFRVHGEVCCGGSYPLCPSPPEFAALFANQTRDRPLWIYEGRPWCYRQRQKWASSVSAPSFELPATKEVAGVIFSTRCEGPWRIAEVRLPGRPLISTDYPLVRAAWLQFCTLPASAIPKL